MSLDDKFTSLRESLRDKSLEYKTATSALGKEKEELSRAEVLCIDAEEALRVVQLVAQTVQQQVHSRIADVVSKCLKAVFDEPYEFKVQFERKRNRTEARLFFTRDGNEVDPMSGAGGGVVDVASFALRVACLLLTKPERRRVIVIDEPFRFVSACYRPRVRKMLEMLSKDLDIQFIMVTHIREIVTGKVVEL